ncbi:RHS repeat-associated core domain-containing protein [Pseudomonas sp. NY11955]|uniref:RHS repeat-associated core domain-containing protein n=1 Tax=Pseudomonas sp. NY11955 TaxID=3400363 RepID=UPI003A8C6259
MPADNHIKFFYQNKKLHTLVAQEVKTALFHDGKMPLAEQVSSDPSRLLATDGNGSVLSDNSSRTQAYSPYGYNSVSISGFGLTAFNGERLDPTSQGYILGNGYRLFSNVLMRFVSADELSPFDIGGLHSYMYCGGDPINRADPSGHAFKWIGNKFFNRQVKKFARIEAYNKGVRERNNQRSRILYDHNYEKIGPAYTSPNARGRTISELVDIKTRSERKENQFNTIKPLPQKDRDYAIKHGIEIQRLDQDLRSQLSSVQQRLKSLSEPFTTTHSGARNTQQPVQTAVTRVRGIRDRFAFNPEV